MMKALSCNRVFSLNKYTIIGLLAGACTTSAFFPQMVQTLKTKHTKDISLGMYSLMTFGILAWFLYGLAIKDLPVILANGVAFIAAGIILVCKLTYK